MEKILRFCLLIILLSFAITAHANDTAFGGSGSLPIPLKQHGVRMKQELIILQGIGLERGNLQGAWQVNCNFTFKNTLDKPLKLRMGFPFPVKEEEGEVAIPTGHRASLNDPLVYDFLVWIDGKPVSAQRYKIAAIPEKGLYYKDAYIWDMTFAPQQTVQIRHQYLMGVTTNVIGQIWATYVLKTGTLWQGGKIGSTKIEVIPNVPTRMCREIKTPEMLAVQPILPGVKIYGSRAQRKYVWEFNNFAPTEDLDLCLQTGLDYIRYNVIYQLLNGKIKPSKLTAEQRKILRNTIFAQYGRTFKNSQLQSYFDKQWWYVKNPNYNNAMLSQDDRKIIAILNK